MGKNTKINFKLVTAVLVAIIGCVSTLPTALAIFYAPSRSVEVSIHATETAEAKLRIETRITSTSIILIATAPPTIINTSSPRITDISISDNFCPPTYGYGYAIRNGDFKPGMSISGPAVLHSFQGGSELGKSLGLDAISRWGINIPSGKTITVPISITLLTGKNYAPEGLYEIYGNEKDISIVQQRWLKNCP